MNRQEKITKTTGQILRENICTLFNLLNLLIAVALVYVHAWSNLFFIFVIAFNTIIGIAQEIKAKRLIEKLSLLSAPKAEVERNGKVQEIAVEEIELEDIPRAGRLMYLTAVLALVVFGAGKALLIVL